MACLLHALDDRLGIERNEGSWVQHFNTNSLFSEFLGDLKAHSYHPAPDDDRKIFAFALNVGLPEGDKILLLRDRTLLAIE